jgi:S-adenosylmethionine-diacylglycerol 3-amino-3-carboxypropyl transferase
MARVLEERLERLACGFPLAENYFAWQAFGRRYSHEPGEGPVPPYLEREHFEAIRSRAARVRVEHMSYTDYLSQQPARCLDRYVLLDAQDWMTDENLAALWTEITRTARKGARVIFRTAGEATILPGRVPDEILGRWRYAKERSALLAKRDRSSIYGAFHLYVLKA